MYRLTTFAFLLIAAPLAAQTPPTANRDAATDATKSAATSAMPAEMAIPGKPDRMQMTQKTPRANQGKPAMDHSKMDHSKMAGTEKMDCMGEDGQCKMMAAGKNTSANPYAEASMASHTAMMKAIGGDASETWTRQMIEHHRGGIAMSKVALDKAQDKDTLANARQLIAAQDLEIGVYQAWLKSRGKSAQ